MQMPETVYVIGDLNYTEINCKTKTLYPYNQGSLDLLESYKSQSGNWPKVSK